MIKFPRFTMKCSKCGGLKYIGEEYYSLGELWVDVTCIQCAHSVDIEVSKLNAFIEKVESFMKNDNK